VAGCAGRRSGPGQLVLSALLLIAAGAGVSPAPAPPAQHDAAAPTRSRAASAASVRKDPASASKSDAPDAALLEYLGEFDDAADGLDAMGLEESARSDAKSERGGQ